MIKASNNFVLFDCKTCSRVSKVGKIAACWTEAHPLDCCIILQIATGKCFKTSCVPGPSTKHHHIWNHIICTDNAFSDIHSHLNLHPLFSSYLSLLILLSWLQRILFPSPSVLLLSSHWLTTVLIFSGWNQIEVFILFLPLLIDPLRCIPPWTAQSDIVLLPFLSLSNWASYQPVPFCLPLSHHLISYTPALCHRCSFCRNLTFFVFFTAAVASLREE